MITTKKVAGAIGIILGKATGSFTKYIVFAATLAMLGSGFYFYYNKSQNQIKYLIEETAKKDLAIQLQNKTIADMRINDAKKDEVLQQLNKELAEARKQDEKPEVESPITNPDTNESLTLEESLKKDLGVTEDFINKQYNDNGKCITLYSGVPIEEVEKNKDEQDKLLKYCGLTRSGPAN